MRILGSRGYTLVEIVVALFVFTTGGLALAAGSALLAREMGNNRLRAEASRLAAGRREIVRSTCRIAQSGSERRGSILSEWTVSPLDSTAVRLAGTVSYMTARGSRTESYSATIACR